MRTSIWQTDKFPINLPNLVLPNILADDLYHTVSCMYVSMCVCVCVIMGCLWLILVVMCWDKERNTTLWSLSGMERVEVTIMSGLVMLSERMIPGSPNAMWCADLSMAGDWLVAEEEMV